MDGWPRLPLKTTAVSSSLYPPARCSEVRLIRLEAKLLRPKKCNEWYRPPSYEFDSRRHEPPTAPAPAPAPPPPPCASAVRAGARFCRSCSRSARLSVSLSYPLAVGVRFCARCIRNLLRFVFSDCRCWSPRNRRRFLFLTAPAPNRCPHSINRRQGLPTGRRRS